MALVPSVALIGCRQDYVDASVIEMNDDVATDRDGKCVGKLLSGYQLHCLVEGVW